MPSQKKILLINPWIYDFAAVDMWMKPLGLLYIASCLRENGYHVDYVDCLDMQHPGMKDLLNKNQYAKNFYGSRKLYKGILPRPDVLSHIHRRWGRYGITEEVFLKEVQALEKPDVILVTSLMTYWYPGPFRVIELIKQVFPGVPVILGGVYASLCTDHAQTKSGADYVFTGESENQLLDKVDELLGMKTSFRVNPRDLDSYPLPAIDLIRNPEYACLMTSRGCPFHCPYCAHDKLSPGYRRRHWTKVWDELVNRVEQFGIKNFVFYDDALAIRPEEMLIPLLKEVISHNLEITFHTPNGLHIRGFSQELADLMYQAGFITIRISLETINQERQQATGGKTDNEQFIRCCQYLHQAGFNSREIGVYLMAMLPGQKKEELESSIQFVLNHGAYPYICEYTPIPGTPMFEEAKQWTSYDIEHEPLLQNNSISPCAWDGFTVDDLNALKISRKTYQANE